MLHRWPLDEGAPVLEEALNIALNYLELTGQAYPYSETQLICARVIRESWWKGTKHRIKLANDAICFMEVVKSQEENTESRYPKAG